MPVIFDSMVSHEDRSTASPRALAALAARLAIAAAIGVAAIPVAAAEREGIFLIDAESDVIHLSDRDAGSGRLIVEIRNSPDGGARARITSTDSMPYARRRAALADIVLSAARAHDLDPALLDAMIGVESGYAERAVSRRGALGLMQLMPATAKQYGVTDAFDPRQNVLAGARHLRALMDQFGQNLTLALAAYNAGATSVWRYRGQIPPFTETSSYVPKVLGSYATLQLRAAAP